MKDDNVKILGAVAICVLLYLLMKKNKQTLKPATPLAAGPSPPVPGVSPRMSAKNTMMTMLEDTFGMSMSMKEPNEDTHILVGRFAACPPKHVIAKQASPTDRTGSCHVTCGGGGWCGDEKGMRGAAPDEVKLQKCCVPHTHPLASQPVSTYVNDPMLSVGSTI